MLVRADGWSGLTYTLVFWQPYKAHRRTGLYTIALDGRLKLNSLDAFACFKIWFSAISPVNIFIHVSGFVIITMVIFTVVGISILLNLPSKHLIGQYNEPRKAVEVIFRSSKLTQWTKFAPNQIW